MNIYLVTLVLWLHSICLVMIDVITVYNTSLSLSAASELYEL